MIKEIAGQLVFCNERLLYKQLETYLEPILSQYQVGFRKGFSVLTTLLAMIKKRRESLD